MDNFQIDWNKDLYKFYDYWLSELINKCNNEKKINLKQKNNDVNKKEITYFYKHVENS